MSTVAVTTQGIQVFVSTDSGTNYKEIKETYDIPEMGSAPQTIEVTHTMSDSVEYINGLYDTGGALSFTANAMPSGTDDSNLDLLMSLDETTTYDVKVVYAQPKVQYVFKAQIEWHMAASGTNDRQSVVYNLTPKSKPVRSKYDATASVTTG